MMTVEIWSDVMCPFCYLGKRKFENALQQFPGKDQVEVIWKSFQLQPDIETDPTASITEFLSKSKGFPIEKARQMNNQLAEAGKKIGLEFNFEDIVVANTFRAHNLLHFAKEHGKQNETKGQLMKAYFTDGKNVDDISTLVSIGEASGLNEKDLTEVLEHETYAEEVQADINESRQMGVRGVPFFVFDRKFAVSGARESSAFLDALDKASTEESKNQNSSAST